MATESDRESFSELSSIIANDSQLIWSRYNAMLTAHGFVGVFLALSLTEPDLPRILIGVAATFFGLFLARCWWRLTVDGWEICHEWVRVAKLIPPPPGRKNPFVIHANLV